MATGGSVAVASGGSEMGKHEVTLAAGRRGLATVGKAYSVAPTSRDSLFK